MGDKHEEGLGRVGGLGVVSSLAFGFMLPSMHNKCCYWYGSLMRLVQAGFRV